MKPQNKSPRKNIVHNIGVGFVDRPLINCSHSTSVIFGIAKKDV